jgi:Na+/melibiose symporter-like transporter
MSIADTIKPDASPSGGDSQHKPFTASAISVHSWAASGISAYWMWKEFMLIQLVFTMGYGIKPEIIAFVYGIPRFLDAIIDPLIGHFSDNFRSRWGRRRPFMLFSSIGAAILVPVIYFTSPDWPDVWQGIYATIVVTAFFICWGMYETSRQALSYELSDDYSKRSEIQAIGQVWFTFPQLIGSMTFAVIIELSKGGIWNFGIPAFRLQWIPTVTLWIGGAILFAIVLAALTTKGRTASVRYTFGILYAIVLLAIAPAASCALHGVDRTKAMIGYWDPNKPVTATSQPASQAATSQASSASAPATQSLFMIEATSQAGPASAPSISGVATATSLPATAAGMPATTTSMPTGMMSMPAAAATSMPNMAIAAEVIAGPLVYGLDYPGYHFFSINFPNLGAGHKRPRIPAAQTVALVGGGMILLFGLIPTFLVKERFKNYNKKHVDVLKALRATITNRPFLVLIFLKISETFGTTLWLALSVYVGIYYVCRGDAAEYSLITTVGGAWVGFLFTLVVWPLAEPLSQKIGKRWGLILSTGILLIMSGITPIVTRPGWVWVIFGFSFIFIFAGAVKQTLIFAIMPDICDIDELTSGERREGLYSAVYTFVGKLESSIIGSLAMFVLAWTGFNSKLASEDVMPTHDVLIKMLWYGLTPYIIFALVAFVIVCFFPLTPKRMEAVRAELEKRRQAAAKMPSLPPSNTPS